MELLLAAHTVEDVRAKHDEIVTDLNSHIKDQEEIDLVLELLNLMAKGIN